MLHIFIGKGGVGKSTVSSLEALKWSNIGKKTLLDSMDPAHNLHDIFQVSLGEKSRKVLPNLVIRESDTEKKSREYMEGIQKSLKGLYHYQQALNLDKFFNLLKNAPGTDEYAALLILQRCLEETKYDEVIVDTPPTALTLKTLALPQINLHWITHLRGMRKEIIDKKRRMLEIRNETPKDQEKDPVFQHLIRMQERFEKLTLTLQDTKQTKINLVLNEDELSFSESLLIKHQLEQIGMSLSRIILNKFKDKGNWEEKIKEEFPGILLQKTKMSAQPLTGLEELKKTFYI